MLKIGDYVRTKKGTIYQFNSTSSKALSGAKKYMVKSSPNIIDLIEVGDFVNGEETIQVINDGKMSRVKSIDGTYFENDIKSIVTKEQFESIEYRIGE